MATAKKYTQKTPYEVGARVEYDPSGNHRPPSKTSQSGTITRVQRVASGDYVYGLALRDNGTPPKTTQLENVPADNVYNTKPEPGPGNDLT